MALEKFACEASLLGRVARHWQHGTGLEEGTVRTIRELERWMAGIQETRYFATALCLGEGLKAFRSGRE